MIKFPGCIGGGCRPVTNEIIKKKSKKATTKSKRNSTRNRTIKSRITTVVDNEFTNFARIRACPTKVLSPQNYSELEEGEIPDSGDEEEVNVFDDCPEKQQLPQQQQSDTPRNDETIIADEDDDDVLNYECPFELVDDVASDKKQEEQTTAAVLQEMLPADNTYDEEDLLDGESLVGAAELNEQQLLDDENWHHNTATAASSSGEAQSIDVKTTMADVIKDGNEVDMANVLGRMSIQENYETVDMDLDD